MATWPLGPSTGRELARLYGVTYHIFKGWLKPFEEEIGKRIGHFYTVRQVIIIVKRLGPPPDTDVSYPGD